MQECRWMPEPFIEVEAVAKRFGSMQALARVSFAAERAKVLALLGPNGAGKTTLVRNLTTLLRPDCGRPVLRGTTLSPTRDGCRP
jgi:ABC-type branched-subunit amino acid transport system ATPase component